MFRYVLTGGHGVGKTSLALFLQESGEHILRETASDYKYVKMAQGIPFPFDNPHAEAEILTQQIRRERDAATLNYCRIFLDRSIIDHFAYAKLLKQSVDEQVISARENLNYDLVFFVDESEDFGIALCTKREIRYSRIVAEAIYTEYQARGNRIVDVPPMPLEKRYSYVMEVISKYEQHG